MSKATGRTIVALVAAILGVIVWVNVIEPTNAEGNAKAECNAAHDPLWCALNNDGVRR